MNAKWSRITFCLILCAAFAMFSACEEDGSDDPEDLAAPQITIDNISAYDPVSGALSVQVTVSDDVGITEVTLLVGGEVVATIAEAPFTLQWDTTAFTDGVATLSARAADASGKTTGTAPVDVVVANAGGEEELDEGPEGTVVIPEGYTGIQEVDVKHHWTSGADGHAWAMAVMQYELPEGAAPWEIELTMGTGYCPHQGQVYGDAVVLTESPVVLVVDEELPGNTQLFVHVKPMDAFDHIEEELPFTMRVFTFDE